MIAPALFIGVGIILISIGMLFLKTHYSRITPNEELEWMGFGEHPFRKQ
jgi:hypothetical protein